MKRAIYTRPAGLLQLFGVPPAPPIEVDVIGEDFERGRVTVRLPLPDNCVINIARRARGLDALPSMVDEVDRDTLTFPEPA